MSVVDRAVGEAPDMRLGEALDSRPGDTAVPPPVGPDERAGAHSESDGEQAPPVQLNTAVISASSFLGAAAAAWVMGGVFSGFSPRLVGLLGAALGAGVVALSYRSRRPNSVQFLVVPLAVVVGGLLILPDATGGSANLPSLVMEALRSGGLGSPPVAFDPGWRVLLVLVAAVLGSASASLAIGFSRPRLGVLLAVPLIFGGILMQPPDAVTVSAVVALVLAIGALAVSFGAELAKEGATTGRFEARRLARGAVILAGLAVVLIGLLRIGFLFPAAEDTRVIPPKRPVTPPAEPDRELFRVKSDVVVPWRLGVLDVYGMKERAWLTPPHDPRRFVDPGPSGDIPEGLPEDVAIERAATFKATFTLSDVRDHSLPAVQGLVAVTGADVEYDPRTQALRSPGRPRRGASYTVEAVVPPDGAALNTAPAPSDAMKPYLEAPEPPQEVGDLLRLAPTSSLYERLQFVRTHFYSKVVAAGAGNPVDVPPERVVDLLAGKEASPYEITAAEALLARWVGVPARIGYGYYGGEADPGETELGVRPKHGATWLEVYFEGHGWVPIVGRPPQAKPSTANASKNDDPSIRPSDQLAMQVYVPLRQRSIQLLYTVVRYWVARTLPVLALLAFVWFAYAGVLKWARSLLRRRWAHARGPRARLAVAYAEFRDVANDFGFGHPTQTPIQFLDAIHPDKELRELTWLVTRGLWGDLMRDLRDQDADAAEQMSRSVIRRLARAQSPLLQALRFSSRVSLRDPYASDIPNPWPKTTPLARLRRRLRQAWGAVVSLGRRSRGRRARPAMAASVLVVVAGLIVGGCAQTIDLTSQAPAAVVDELPVPDELAGSRLQREQEAEKAFASFGDEALVSHGRVYSVRQGDDVQASLQMAWFKPGLKDRSGEVRRGVLRRLENGSFRLVRVGDERVYLQRLPEQTMMLWFPPDMSYYVLLVGRLGYDPAPFMRSLLAFQRGDQVEDLDEVPAPPPVDPLRGSA